MRYLTFISLFILLLTGCDSYDQDTYREYVVVESYAVANDTLPEVNVFTTSPADEQYLARESVITNANVQIVLLDENGNDEEVFNYVYSPGEDTSYVYKPIDTTHRVLPTRTYRLDVNFDDRPEIIQATTTVPDDFTIINEVPVSIPYQSPDQLELTLSPTEKTQPQNVFVFSSVALHVRVDNMTPFYRASVDEDGVEVSDFKINSSGLINEGNFEENPDGTITLQFPWIGVAFYGETLIVTQSVDKNIVDLVRSQQVQLGGSTLSPGEIPNPIYQTEGGIGVFGSLASDTVSTIFLRPS